MDNQFTGFSLEFLQTKFDTNLEELAKADEDSLEFISQSHSGDLLIEQTESNKERYNLWKNISENGGGVEVEYCGAANNYTWESVFELI